jgi:mannose/fructose-specific phosphotransferase system component IIA
LAAVTIAPDGSVTEVILSTDILGAVSNTKAVTVAIRHTILRIATFFVLAIGLNIQKYPSVEV